MIPTELYENLTGALIRNNAIEMSDQEKIKIIEQHFAQIMHTLGLDLNDDSLRGTPRRVAKMFVKEIFPLIQ